MHMKSCPKLVRSELRLEPGTRSVNRGPPGGVVGVVGGVRGRSPLSVISANTLHHGNNNHNNVANGPGCHGDAWRRKAKGSQQGGEGLYRKGGGGGATGVEGEGPVDIWAVIKPGNVRQKIAIFTSVVGPPTEGPDGWGSEDAPKHQVTTTPGSVPAGRAGVSLKVKGGVRDRESCSSSAKRRRRSGSNRHHHHLHHQQRELHPTDTSSSSSPGGDEPLSQAARSGGREVGCGEEEEGGVCVVDMVALLEQKASVNNTHTSCSTAKAPPPASPTASLATAPPSAAAPPLPPTAPHEGSEAEEGSEVVRVSDMVARLESECLKRSNSTSGGGGGLSRSSSLRRCQPSPPPPPLISSSSPPSPQPEAEVVPSASPPVVPVRPSWAERGSDREEAPKRPHVCLEDVRGPRPTGGDFGGLPQGPPEPEPPTSSSFRAEEPQPEDHSDSRCRDVCSLNPEPATPEEEPPPGMLFFLSSGPLHAHAAYAPTSTLHAPTHATETSMHIAHAPTHATEASMHIAHAPTQETQASTQTAHASEDPEDACSTPPLPASDCGPASPCELEPGREAEEEERRSSSEDSEEEERGGGLSVVACFPLHRSVSLEFLAVRQRIQRLLDPQPFLTLLPHHLLVHVFSLLPTRSLAALQCACHYFRLVIRSYGVRPADSRWVVDPRYRDDPCKQCKRRYAGRGDVSLCRWHHKPYCQAHPYGPGFWMCCHGSRRDAPGCNVGLHDNRWVPAFHSVGGCPALDGRGAGQRNEDSMED